MQIVIFEDEKVHRLGPLVHFKPVYYLSAGCRTLLGKFRFHLGPHVDFSCHSRKYLQPVYRGMLPLFHPAGDVHEDLLLVNGRLLCDERSASIMLHNPPAPGQCLVQDEEVIFARVNAGNIATQGAALPDVIDTAYLSAVCEVIGLEGFKLIRNIWDPVALHPGELEREAGTIELGNLLGEVSSRAALENPQNIYVGKGARVKSGAILDAESGFVYIGSGAVVGSQAVLAENIFLDRFATVKTGGNLHSNVAVGNYAKVGGEIEDSVVESYANKQHEGFLGHSYISSWCNLGAGSNTSDLRNNYGKVKIILDGEKVQTGEQFLGLLMGEHSKCSINSMFDTGTVAGTSANIFGNGFSPKNIPSFSWGGSGQGFQHYAVEKALETARVVMQRRGVEMSAEYEAMFRYVAALEQAKKISV